MVEMSGAELLALLDDEHFYDGEPVGWLNHWVEFENGAPMLHIKFEHADGELQSGKWMLIKQEDNRG